MKRIKRLASLLLAMVMALAMTMTAFATGETIDPDAVPGASDTKATTPEDDSKDGELNRTFKLYQIFTGDPETSGDGSVTGTLSNVKWGFSAAISDSGKIGDPVPESVLENLTAPKLEQGGPDSNDRIQLAVIEQYTNFDAPYSDTQPELEGTTYKYTNLPSGYYLIEDTTTLTDIQDGNTTRSLYVVRVTNGTLEFTPKVSGVPTPDKSVQDTNDSKEAVDNPAWDKSADYDIGDTIPYQITATLPDATSMNRYTEYKLTFHDEFSDGLDYVEITDIKIGTESIMDQLGTADYSANYDGATKELNVTFNDVKKAPINAKGGEKIIIEYTAILNDKAVTGSIGNPNTLVLEYPNEPSYNGNGTPGTGTTPPVTAIVFTFRTVINKVDDTVDHKPLAGAEFTLYKWMEAEADWVKLNITPNVTGDGTTFDFKGLDDGTYKLEESKTPNGYNTMADMIFKVVVTHNETSGDSNALTKIEILDENDNIISGENKQFEIVNLPDSGKDGVETDIVNNKGSLLPSTGGIGTTIFYIIGGILVVGAGILLVTKKRMSAR